MLSFGDGYVRLDIHRDDEFASVSESIRALLHVCRLNALRGALLVSRQDAFDWRSSLRIGLRFAASRAAIAPGLRLALVAEHFNDGARDDVLAVASQAGLECRVFRAEPDAIAWLGAASRT
jgi:hypothetical protein